MSQGDHELDSQRPAMVAGVRRRIVHVARGAGAGVRRWTPPVLLAVLSAGAFAPLLSVASGSLLAAGLQIVESVGGGVLTEVITRSVERLRKDRPDATQEQIGDELQRQIEQVLDAGGRQAEQLRDDLAGVLREIGAVGAAVEEIVRTGDEALQDELVRGFAGMAEAFAEFGDVVGAVREATFEIRETLRRQDAGIRRDREQLRTISARLQRMDERLVRSARRTPEASEAGAGGDIRWLDGCPYRGLSPFQEDQAVVFYGREQATRELVDQLAGRLDGPGLLVVTGPSGAGKSSLLRAGMLPALARGELSARSMEWPRLVMSPTGSPLLELATHLAALSGADPATVHDRLADEPERAHLLVRQAVLADAERRGLPKARDADRLVLIVDQFEELFTLADAERPDDAAEAQQLAFITALHAAATTPAGPSGQPAALVVIAVRGDHWDRCTAYPQIAETLPDSLFIVGPMTEIDLRRAITGPADAAGLEIEAGLVDAILTELRSDTAAGGYETGALPWLSQAMLTTWEHREDNRLTSHGYGRSGGVRDAVQTSADETYESLTPAGRLVAEQVFHAMTGLDHDGRPTRRRVTRDDLKSAYGEDAHADVDAVLEAFAAKRLLVLNDGYAEIAHDELLRAWTLLRSWLEHDRADHVRYQQLLADAAEWQHRDRDSSYLYKGTRLKEFSQAETRWGADPSMPPLPAGARRFLDAATRAQRASRLRRGALVPAAAVIIAVAVIAFNAMSNAINNAVNNTGHQHALVLSRELASQSEHQTDANTAARLAAAAWQTAHTPEARYALLSISARPAQGALIGHTDKVYDVVFSPDGKTLASASQDGTVRLWDVATHHQIATPLTAPTGSTGHVSAVRGVAFSPDGKTLASASLDGTIRLWDVGTHHQIGKPLTAHTGHTGLIYSVAFSPDGRTLASASLDKTVRLWDVTTHHQIGKPLTGHTGPVYSVAFSPNGKTLASASEDKTVRLWDVAARRQIGTPLNVHTHDVYRAAFSPDGRTLVSVGGDNTVRLWDVATHHQIGKSITGGTFVFSDAAFSPDGKTLATTSSDVNGGKTVRLWDVTTHRQIGKLLTGHTDPIVTMSFSPDGKTVATAGADKTVRLLNIATHQQIGDPLRGHPAAVDAVAFSPDGKTIASSGDEDGTIRLWDVATHRQIGASLLGDPHVDVTGVVFSPDGKTLATVGFDEKVRLWDVATHRQIGKPLVIQTAQTASLTVPEVEFSPDGRTLACAGYSDETVRLWDVATHRQIGGPLPGHSGNVRGMAFSPDGKTLASASDDKTVRLWNVATHRQIGKPLTGNTDEVDGVAFSPDGRTLATAGVDNTVRLWDVASHGQIGGPLSGHTKAVLAVAFSPDGRTLASASVDKTVRLWNVSTPENLLAAACAVAGRPFTRTEWQNFAPGEPYQPACG